MMFAITIGEIGLQTAALVHSTHLVHYLPAFFHLVLATIVVAASWVGWSRSLGPSRKDVNEVFEWPFVVLLLDMVMVVTYFILVRTVDSSDHNHDVLKASTVAGWHVLIFVWYILWDVVTKFLIIDRQPGVTWLRAWRELAGEVLEERRERQLRAIPTVICLILSIVLWYAFDQADYEHYLTADIALLSVVLLFRALKSLFPAIWQSKADHRAKKPRELLYRWAWTIACVGGLVVGTWMTAYSRPLPFPDWIIQEMRTPVSDETAPLAGAIKRAARVTQRGRSETESSWAMGREKTHQNARERVAFEQTISRDYDVTSEKSVRRTSIRRRLGTDCAGCS